MEEMKTGLLEASDAMKISGPIKDTTMQGALTFSYAKLINAVTITDRDLRVILYIFQQCHDAVGINPNKSFYKELVAAIKLMRPQDADKSNKKEPQDQTQSDEMPEDKQQPQDQTQPDEIPADKQQPQDQTQTDDIPTDEQQPQDQTQSDPLGKNVNNPNQYPYYYGFYPRRLRNQKNKLPIYKKQPQEQIQSDEIPASGQNGNYPTQYDSAAQKPSGYGDADSFNLNQRNKLSPYKQQPPQYGSAPQQTQKQASAESSAYASAESSAYQNQGINQLNNQQPGFPFNNQQPSQYSNIPQTQSFSTSDATSYNPGQGRYPLNNQTPQSSPQDPIQNQGGANANAFSAANSDKTSYETAPVKNQPDSSNYPYSRDTQKQPPPNFFGNNNQGNPNPYQKSDEGFPENNAQYSDSRASADASAYSSKQNYYGFPQNNAQYSDSGASADASAYNSQQNYYGFPQNNAQYSDSEASADAFAYNSQQTYNGNNQPYTDSSDQRQTPIENKAQPDPKQQNAPATTSDKTENCKIFVETMYWKLYKAESFVEVFHANTKNDQVTSMVPFIIYDGLCSAGYKESIAQEIALNCIPYMGRFPEPSTTRDYAAAISKVLMEQLNLKDYIGNDPKRQAEDLGKCLLDSLDKIEQQSSPQENNSKPNDLSANQQTLPNYPPKSNDDNDNAGDKDRDLDDEDKDEDYPYGDGEDDDNYGSNDENSDDVSPLDNLGPLKYQLSPQNYNGFPQNDAQAGAIADSSAYNYQQNYDGIPQNNAQSGAIADSSAYNYQQNYDGIPQNNAQAGAIADSSAYNYQQNYDDILQNNAQAGAIADSSAYNYQQNYDGFPQNNARNSDSRESTSTNQKPPKKQYYIANDENKPAFSNIKQQNDNIPTAEPKKPVYTDYGQNPDKPVDFTGYGPIDFPPSTPDDSQNLNSTKNNKLQNDTESKDRIKKIIKLVLDCKKGNKFDYKQLSKGIADIVKSIQDAHPDWTATKAQKRCLVEFIFALTKLLFDKENDGKCITQQPQQIVKPEQITPLNQGSYQNAPQIDQKPTYPIQQTNQNSQLEIENKSTYQPVVVPTNTISAPLQTTANAYIPNYVPPVDNNPAQNINSNNGNQALQNNPNYFLQIDNNAAQNRNRNIVNQAWPSIPNFVPPVSNNPPQSNWNNDNQAQQIIPNSFPQIDNNAGLNRNWNIDNQPRQNIPSFAPPISNNPPQINWNNGNLAQQQFNQIPAPQVNNNAAQNNNLNNGNQAWQNNPNLVPPIGNNAVPNNNLGTGNQPWQGNPNPNFPQNVNPGVGGVGQNQPFQQNQQFQQPQRW